MTLIWELYSNDTYLKTVFSRLVYLGNNQWSSPTFGNDTLIPTAASRPVVSGVRFTYDFSSTEFSSITINIGGTDSFIEVLTSNSGIQQEFIPDVPGELNGITTDVMFGGHYASLAVLRDIYIAIEGGEPPESDKIGLYKLENFDQVLVEAPNPPPQINRPPPLIGLSGYRPNSTSIFDESYQSFGTTTAPNKGSSSNTNTNNRNPENTDRNPVSIPRNLEELLEIMHENNVSGMQY